MKIWDIKIIYMSDGAENGSDIVRQITFGWSNIWSIHCFQGT